MRILIIGGGYSGACFAIQALVRSGYSLMPGYVTSGTATKTQKLDHDLQITIVEPREELGQGVAYSSNDPDHRINAPSWGHMVLANDVTHFHQWFLENGGLQRDPQAEDGGLLFPRRIEFGRYLGFLLERPLAEGVVRHVQDQVVGLENDGSVLSAKTTGGIMLEADRIVIATGHLPTSVPGFVSAQARSHRHFVDSPWRVGALDGIASNARVLIIGSGLTAADVIASLIRGGHEGPIWVISRRGLRPQALPPPTIAPPLPIWSRLQQPIPDFLRMDIGPMTVRALMRALRARIAVRAAEGLSWHEAFDDLRDALYKIWSTLDTRNQRQFLRHLRPWYDAYRYRMPPQTGTVISQAEATGQLVFEAAQVIALTSLPDDSDFRAKVRTRGSNSIRDQHFDAVVNCTGPGQVITGVNPLFDDLLTKGIARVHASGIGLDVDQHMGLVNSTGRSDPAIRLIGPPGSGALGDPIGAVFICAHIDRMMGPFLAC